LCPPSRPLSLRAQGFRRGGGWEIPLANLTAAALQRSVKWMALAFPGLEWGVGAGVDDVAVEEEVAEHRAGLAEFNVAVECVGYALDGVEFCCDTCGA
jgi:hypothetical protein